VSSIADIAHVLYVHMTRQTCSLGGQYVHYGEHMKNIRPEYYQVHGVEKVDKLVKENPTAFRCLNWIANGSRGADGVYYSHADLAEMMGCCKKTIQRSVKYLKDNGYIQTVKQDRSSRIYLNPMVAWKGSEADRIREIRIRAGFE